MIDFNVFNSGSGDTTIIPGAGITAASALTGGNNMVVASGTTATFRLMGTNSTGAANNFQISRLN